MEFTYYVFQDEPLRQWVPLHQEYLDELLRHEGRGDYPPEHCPRCPKDQPAGSPIMRCKDCLMGELLCTQCCRIQHAQHPLHVVEVRNLTKNILIFEIDFLAAGMEREELQANIAQVNWPPSPTWPLARCSLSQPATWSWRFHHHSYKRYALRCS